MPTPDAPNLWSDEHFWSAEIDDIRHDLKAEVAYGKIVISPPWFEHPGREGHDCRCGDIHEPGDDWDHVDTDVIRMRPEDAIAFARQILELAVPLHNTTTITNPTAVATCVNLVREMGAVNFMELSDALKSQLRTDGNETMTVGIHRIGNGVTMREMNNPPNVVLWNCGSPEFLTVIEEMLAHEPDVVLERTDVDSYRYHGMQLIEDYSDDGRKEVLLPALDFDDEIAADGYDTPHWVPVYFAWAGAD